MTTIEELKTLRDEKVQAALEKLPKRKTKRKRGVRPPDAKMTVVLPEPKKAEEPLEESED